MTQADSKLRGEWPSASQAAANKKCQGKHVAEVGIPEPPQSPDAESGTAIHSAAYGPNPIRELTEDEKETLAGIQLKEAMIVRAWAPTGFSSGVKEFREHRLWNRWIVDRILSIESVEYRCSGQADVIYIDPPRALICDYKTGRKQSEAESSNAQLRWLAALTAINAHELCGQPITEVTVALVQHWAASNPPCVYDCYALGRAIEEMEHDVEAWYQPDAKRTPNPVSCEYCRAKATCPEFAAQVYIDWRDAEPTVSNQIWTAIARMDGQRLGLFLSLGRLAVDCADGEIRKRLAAAPGSVDGWQLSPGRTTETITNPNEVYNRFLELGGTSEQFMPCVKIVKTALKDSMRTLTNDKGKALEHTLKMLLDGCTESKTGNPVLERE
jgi:hypothetical protein